jgi:hypothetical protein
MEQGNKKRISYFNLFRISFQQSDMLTDEHTYQNATECMFHLFSSLFVADDCVLSYSAYELDTQTQGLLWLEPHLSMLAY